MDKYRDRLCSEDYKKEITRSYRQLMLLQLQGYLLWSTALNIVHRDSSIIADRYTEVLEKQTKYLQGVTCPAKIPNSKNVQDCASGFYIHKSMKMKSDEVSCKDGYFHNGKCFNILNFGMEVINICSDSKSYLS